MFVCKLKTDSWGEGRKNIQTQETKQNQNPSPGIDSTGQKFILGYVLMSF